MHIVDAEGEAGAPIAGVPEVDAAGQGGLLDVALAPDFAESRTIFFSFAEPRESGGNATSVTRARLETGEANSGALEDVAVIFRQTPSYDGDKPFGSRLVFAPDGRLVVPVGEPSDPPIRPEERRGGNECVRPGGSRG